MDKVLGKIRNLDAYPKINEDFFSRTLSGGVITLVSSLIIILLFFSELSSYLRTTIETKLIVDTSRGGRLHINFDVDFPGVPCSLLSLDAMDISGERHFDIVKIFPFSPPLVTIKYRPKSDTKTRHDIFKKRLDTHGNVLEVKQGEIGATKIEKPLQRHGGRLEKDEKYCGSCFGAEMSDDQCCNSCEEVREAYRKKGWGLTNADLIDQCQREGFVDKVKNEKGEGCNIHGSLEVNKVAGNFHFATGKSFHQSNFNLHELLALETDIYNITHKINKLAFGDNFPGIQNPLDGVQWTQGSENGIYQYFVKVVPTIYTDIRGRKIQSNQFSVTEHFKGTEFGIPQVPPGVYFYYDLSPIKVTFTENHVPFLHFITYLCGLIGGIFTVAGIVDSFVYHGQKAIKKKTQIGKFS